MTLWYVLYILVLAIVGLIVGLTGIILVAPIAYVIQLDWHGGEEPRGKARFGAKFLRILRFDAGARLDMADADEPFAVWSRLLLFGRERQDRGDVAELDSAAPGRQPESKAEPQETWTERDTFLKRFLGVVTMPVRVARNLLRVMRVVPDVVRFVGRLYSELRPHYSSLTGSFAFDDPFVTSQVYAMILTGNVPGHFSEWTFRPSFGEGTNRGKMTIEGRFTLGAIVVAVLGLVLRRPVRQELQRMWRARRKRRRGNKKSKRVRTENS